MVRPSLLKVPYLLLKLSGGLRISHCTSKDSGISLFAKTISLISAQLDCDVRCLCRKPMHRRINSDVFI